MKTKLLSVIVVTVALTVACSRGLAFAQKGPGADDPAIREKIQQRKDALYKELGLSAEQQKKLDIAQAANRGQMEKIQKAIHIKREELRAELDKPNTSEAKAYGIGNEIKALMGETMDLRIKDMLTLKKILTPSQFAKLQEKIKTGVKERFGGRNKMPPPPEGPGGPDGPDLP